MYRLAPLVLLGLAQSSLAADWPQWRGPGRDGHAVGAQLPANFPAAAPSPKWSVDVGLGYSGPVVSAGKLFIHVRDDEKKSERCLCLDALTGKPIWEVSYSCGFQPPDPTAGKGPNATPTVDRDRVFFFGIGGMLTCIDIATGKVLWQHACDKEYWGVKKTALGDDAWFPPCGASASALVDGDTIIIPIGGKKAGAISGFDRNTGKLLWTALDDRSSYASPCIASPGGVKQLVAFTGTRMVGLRLSDRELLWDYPFPTKFEQTIVSPVVWKDRVVVGGEARPTVALKLTPDGNKVKKEVAWKSEDLRMYLTTPMVFNDHLIGFDQRASRLVCLELDTGKTVWTSSNLGTKNAVLLLAGDVLFTQTLEGELRIARITTEEYKELAKWKVAGRGTYAHPALVENMLFVKGPEKLTCFEMK